MIAPQADKIIVWLILRLPHYASLSSAFSNNQLVVLVIFNRRAKQEVWFVLLTSDKLNKLLL